MRNPLREDCDVSINTWVIINASFIVTLVCNSTFCFLPALRDQYKKTTCVGKDVDKLEPLYAVVGTQNGVATMENSMEIPQKLNIELPCTAQGI